jgi:hypothetical protein
MTEEADYEAARAWCREHGVQIDHDVYAQGIQLRLTLGHHDASLILATAWPPALALAALRGEEGASEKYWAQQEREHLPRLVAELRAKVQPKRAP